MAKRESGTSGSDSWKCKLALICVATVLGVVGIEVTTRAFLPSPELRAVSPHWTPGLLVPHQTRSYAYAPNYFGEIRTDEYRVAFMTNELGLRDDPIAITSHQTRILAVGDSFTVGFGVEAEDTWPARLQSALNGDHKMSQPVRVINAGVSGYSARQIADAV